MVGILYASHILSAWVCDIHYSNQYYKYNVLAICWSMYKSGMVRCLWVADHAPHVLPPQGDRMWGFAVSIFLALLYPGSLLIPGVYGFSVQLCVGMFGTVVGDWVDTTPRMRGGSLTARLLRPSLAENHLCFCTFHCTTPPPPPHTHTHTPVAWMSLLIQNSLVALCAVTLALMFSQGWDVCQNVAVFSCLTVVVTLLGSGSMLATVANTISIEKDWVVVLADGNKDTLAGGEKYLVHGDVPHLSPQLV